jgi:transcriptional regulator with XRE-family HTH domain
MENAEVLARKRVYRLIRTGRLAELRESAGLSQGDVGRGIGLSQSTVSRWEAGKAIPLGRHAVALLELLDGEP